MGYLDNKTVTVDAILTKKGRELLSKGKGNFEITQFALADDEVDYGLWNEAHPGGSDQYGIAIENMPVVEAFPNETLAMKYKLVTLGKNTTKIPRISTGGVESINLDPTSTYTITPSTDNIQGANSTYGYTAILSDSEIANLNVTEQSRATGYASEAEDDKSQTVYKTGHKFSITPKQVSEIKYGTITIVGYETGGRTVINLTVQPVE